MRSTRVRRLSTLLGLVVQVGGLIWSVFAFQPFGDRSWAFATVVVGVTVLGANLPGRLGRWRSLRCGQEPEAPRSTRRAVCFLIFALAAWLGLIAWSGISPGGPAPRPKADPSEVRVLTWNILHGNDGGAPWDRWGWPTRKRAIRTVLEETRPDVLCVQEALEGQVTFLETVLPDHRRVGVGRDDGRSAGEYCAIFFDKARFEEIDGGTFWLEEPLDQPPCHAVFGPKRICTWVRLRDRPSGRHVRVYNTHLYLTEGARRQAVERLLSRIAGGDPTDAILVAGDFNAPPDASSRRLFAAAGLLSSALLAGETVGSPTYHFYGIRLKTLDDILVGRGWQVGFFRVLDVKPGNTFPSDHFGVMADLALRAG